SFGKNHKYVQALAHSDNDDITGTWSVDKRLLYDKDGGHGMIFVTREGNYCLTLHSPNIPQKEHPVFIPIRYQDGVLTIAPGKEDAT
ncbi:MAG: glycoside hydrolase, partial [Lachnospiraceae bacterium]